MEGGGGMQLLQYVYLCMEKCTMYMHEPSPQPPRPPTSMNLGMEATIHWAWIILFRAQSIGSANLDPLPPRSPRLSAITTNPNYSPSAQGYYTYSTSTPPATRVRKSSQAPIPADTAVSQTGSSTLDPTAMMPPTATPWKRKLSQTMKHLVVSPRFHRKRYDGSALESSTGDLPVSASPQLWVLHWKLGGHVFSLVSTYAKLVIYFVVPRDPGSPTFGLRKKRLKLLLSIVTRDSKIWRLHSYKHLEWAVL